MSSNNSTSNFNINSFCLRRLILPCSCSVNFLSPFTTAVSGQVQTVLLFCPHIVLLQEPGNKLYHGLVRSTFGCPRLGRTLFQCANATCLFQERLKATSVSSNVQTPSDQPVSLPNDHPYHELHRSFGCARCSTSTPNV